MALILQNILRGGGKTDSIVGMKTCGVWFWLVYGVFIIFCLCICIFTCLQARREYLAKIECGYNFIEGDPQYTPKTMLILIIVSCFGGVIAAIVGLGGAVIYGPLLLEMGVNAPTTGATSMFLVLYTSMSNSIQYGFGK